MTAIAALVIAVLALHCAVVAKVHNHAQAHFRKAIDLFGQGLPRQAEAEMRRGRELSRRADWMVPGIYGRRR
jgi:hypothetical protein